MTTVKDRIHSILFWSVISAAFIGPGTLAAASSAGASYGYGLLWALIFATGACFVLQEMAARVSVISGKTLGALLSEKNTFVSYFVGLSVVTGCAAYEAGNILGAISGASLVVNLDKTLLTILLSVSAALLLWLGKLGTVSKTLGVLVAVMGVVFIAVATKSSADIPSLFSEGLVPSIPDGGEWLVLALIGTTIVPYNIYLGSGLSMGRRLHEMRFGLFVSVTLGGIISCAILIVGAQAKEILSFVDIASVLRDRLGQWAYAGLGVGLFAAGFTSSVTAPMAAGIVFSGLFNAAGKSNIAYYRLGWILVLLTGLIFGLLDVKPLPVILAAQALNGLILPVLGVILIIQSNNRALLKDNINSLSMNTASFVVLEVLLLLGLNNVWKTLDETFFPSLPNDLVKFLYLQGIAMLIIAYTVIQTVRRRWPQ